MADEGKAIAVDKSGFIYITGIFGNSAIFGFGEAHETILSGTSEEVFIAKYDTDGNLLWAKSTGGMGEEETGFAVALDDAGNIYVTGNFSLSATFGFGEPNQTILNSVAFDDVFIAKYASDGSLLWAEQAGGSSFDAGKGIDVDSAGNVYVGGTFILDVTFAAGQPNETTLSATGQAPFLAKYEDNGTFSWATSGVGSAPSNGLLGLATEKSGRTYITGFFGESITFGKDEVNETTLSSMGVTDIYIARFQSETPLPHDFLFLAEKEITITRLLTGDGDIHSNNDIVFKRGRKGTHTGNLTAVDDVKIKKKNMIAGDDVKNSGTVTGTITEDAAVAEVPLPILNFSAGGEDKKVPRKGSLTLAPGSYGKVKFKKRGTLFLSSGEYFFEELKTAKSSVISIDVTNGPVTINVEDKLEFKKKTRVEITPTGETGSDQVTFNVLDDDDVEIENRAIVLGTIVAPEADVELKKNVRFRGAICAEEIKVGKNAVLLHHNSAMSLPKALPDDDEEETDELLITSVPEEFQLLQNYPNPFNPRTTIRFTVPHSSEVKLAIYNLRGQLVRTLHSGSIQAGHHQVVWDDKDNRGGRVASGIYVYRLQAGDFVAHKKLVLTK